MSNTTTSPNMGMPIPTVSVDPGPDWATNIDASLNIVDSHNHSSGQGVQIGPSGMNMNADLPMNNNNLTTARSVRFQPQTPPIAASSPDLGCLYESGVDLYYNDGSGNQIRITSGGTVSGSSGTITGLPSGTASASYSAGTFTWQSATSTPATMNSGPLIIGNQIANSPTVTISPNVSIGSDYNFILPAALPGSTDYTTLDNSGNLSYNTSGSTGTGAVVLASGPNFSGTITGVIDGGIWSPTFTYTIAPSSVVSVGATYTRINNVVSVSVSIVYVSNSSASATSITSMTIPIATSSLTNISGIELLYNITLANQAPSRNITNSGNTLIIPFISFGGGVSSQNVLSTFQFNYTVS